MENQGMQEMTPKRRLMNTIYRKTTDRPACICPGGMMNMITTQLLTQGDFSFCRAHSDGRTMADLAEYAYKEGCFENVGVPFCMTVEAEQLGAQVDLGDDTREPRVTGYAMKELSEWRDLLEFDLSGGRPRAVLDAIGLLAQRQKEVPVVGNLTGPISTASSVLDPALFFSGMRKKPEEVHGMLSFITGELVKFGRAMIEAGADVIMIADPSGTGEIMGPRFFKEYTVKYLNMLIDGNRKEGIPVIVHICGQMKPVLKEMAEIKSDVLSFDAIVPLKDIKEQLPGRVLMGNVSTYAIEEATPEKVKQLSSLCAGQGFAVVSPACGLGMGSPLSNVKAVLSGVQEAVCRKS